MELVIGGRAQGKLAYVLTKYQNAEVISGSDPGWKEKLETAIQSESAKTVPIVWNEFHLSMKDWLSKGMELDELWNVTATLMQEIPTLVIISDEIGNGIVPMDREERRWREETGRMLCRIAAKATLVERVSCGLPIRIK